MTCKVDREGEQTITYSKVIDVNRFDPETMYLDHDYNYEKVVSLIKGLGDKNG